MVGPHSKFNVLATYVNCTRQITFNWNSIVVQSRYEYFSIIMHLISTASLVHNSCQLCYPVISAHAQQPQLNDMINDFYFLLTAADHQQIVMKKLMKEFN